MMDDDDNYKLVGSRSKIIKMNEDDSPSSSSRRQLGSLGRDPQSRSSSSTFSTRRSEDISAVRQRDEEDDDEDVGGDDEDHKQDQARTTLQMKMENDTSKSQYLRRARLNRQALMKNSNTTRGVSAPEDTRSRAVPDSVVSSSSRFEDTSKSDDALSYSCICSFAASRASSVYGLSSLSSSSSSTTISSNGEKPLWQTSLSPHTVTYVTSNASGTIVVAATDAGTVSLLRGNDGAILATRSVATPGEDVPLICWIPGASDGSDALLIEAPIAAATAPNTFVLVTRLCGKTLLEDDNHPSPSSSSEQKEDEGAKSDAQAGGLSSSLIAAAQAMRISTVQLPAGSSSNAGTSYLRAASGAFLDHSTIRLVACDADGNLIVYNYDLETCQITVVKDSISIFNPSNCGIAESSEQDGMIDYEMGLVPQTFGTKTYFLCTALGEKWSAIYWFDPDSQATACHFIFPSSNAGACSCNGNTSCPHRPKILALEPITTTSSDTLAVAVAVSSSTAMNSPVTIHVLQVLTDEIMNLFVLRQPHILFTIKINNGEPVSSVQLAAFPGARPFSFRYKYRLENKLEKIASFSPEQESSSDFAKLRKMIEQGRFVEVDNFMSSDRLPSALSHEHVPFHPSEVPFRRLQSLLATGCLASEEALQLAHTCLRRLAEGAVKGGGKGLDYFLKAADYVAEGTANPSVRELTMVLTVLASSMDGIYKALPIERRKEVAEKKRVFHNRLLAIKFLGTIVRSDERLAAPLHPIRSLSHLFDILIEQQKFAVAELLWRTELKSNLSTATVIKPLLKITGNVHPDRYITLFQVAVFPSLSMGHELLGPLRSWACRTSDAFDDSNDQDLGLGAAIVLLEAIDKGTRDLQVKVHASFSTNCPLVDRKATTASRPALRNLNSSSAVDCSRSDPLDTSMSSSLRGAIKRRTNASNDGARPAPTILELSALKEGPSKAKFGMLQRSAGDDYNSDDCVESKLRAARCLQLARSQGLPIHSIQLQKYEAVGGAEAVLKELVAHISRSSSDHESRMELMNRVNELCQVFSLSRDDAILACVNEICQAKGVTKKGVDDATSLSQCCNSPVMRSKALLSVLRAALQCGYAPASLSTLSKRALEWSSCDSNLRSQLEEASRLLFIDGIVLKYCGSGARDMFRVDNPRHPAKLLDYVARHIYHDGVLSDALALCDAFTHLDARDASVLILQHATMKGETQLCSTIMGKLIARDQLLAEKVLARLVLFVDEILVESSLSLKQSKHSDSIEVVRRNAVVACDCAVAVIALMLEKKRFISALAGREIFSFLRSNSLESLKQDFYMLYQLQTRFSLFLSLSDLSEPRTMIAAITQMLRPVVEAHFEKKNDSLHSKIAFAKRACSIIASGGKFTMSDIWLPACGQVAVAMVKQKGDDRILEFMEAVGISDGDADGDFLASRSLSAVAVTMCSKATSVKSPEQGMRFIAGAASLLRDQALASAEERDLPSIVTLGAVVETVAEVLMTTDEGKGEYMELVRKSTQNHVWERALPPGCKQSIPGNKQRHAFHRPKLHATWYVGDGLLLPPQDGLLHGLRFSKDLLSHLSTSSGAMELYKCVRDSGSHFLALRVISSSAIHFLTNLRQLTDNNIEIVCEDLATGSIETSKALAQRSIGGSSRTGITSGLVDSQLAVSFLLSLNLKQAFEIYKTSLPAARKLSDFRRLFTLATIGVVASSPPKSYRSEGVFAVGWEGQKKFNLQCQSLARQSMWWAILQHFNVQFDCQRLGNKKLPGPTGPDPEIQYSVLVLSHLIATLSQVMDPTAVLRLANLFADDFSIPTDMVVQKHIEFLLSPPESAMTKSDPRCDLSRCESIVKQSLRLVRPSTKRSAVIRSCLINLEKSEGMDTDYERFSLVLSLYREALVYVLDKDATMRGCDLTPFEAELELIERRRDALTILSSFFQGERRKDRPSFPSFFLRLGEEIGHEDLPPGVSISGILGDESEGNTSIFDPLGPLDPVLASPSGSAATPVLASMCMSLAVPQGYVHARHLMKMFYCSDENHFPSFEDDVIPVVSRIRGKSSDRVQLMEWIAKKYNKDEDKLKCLDLALKYAMEASAELESRGDTSQKGDSDSEVESYALDTVKRLGLEKSNLSDRLRVKAILRSIGDSDHGAISAMVENLINELGSHVKREENLTPDNLVEILFTSGSLLVANACLDEELHFPTKKVRQLCTAIREAGTALSEEHSHINPSYIAKRFARKWLFFGDEKTSSMSTSPRAATEPSRQKIETLVVQEASISCDDEIGDFVMDLEDLNVCDDEWEPNEDALTHQPVAHRFTSDEEPSALQASASREISETSSQRAGIRIAFLLAVASDYGSPVSSNNRENETSMINRCELLEAKRSRILSKRDSKRESPQDNKLMEISRELLQIVFAQCGATERMFCSDTSSFDFDDTDTFGAADSTKVATFAMRHRALRAATFLCPQEALERVAEQDGLLSVGTLSMECTLRDCTFGAFLAKEIEEMGLPLPHSDLRQLSGMHFGSYARSLWRHHREGYKKGQQGRLYLLLLEMGLRNEPVDNSFLDSILSEITRMQLPRTLLLSMERIIAYEETNHATKKSIQSEALTSALSTASKLMLSAWMRLVAAESVDEKELPCSLCSMERLSKILICLSTWEAGRSHLANFVNSFGSISSSCKHEPLIVFSKNILKNCMRCLQKIELSSRAKVDSRAQADALGNVSSVTEDCTVLQSLETLDESFNS